MYSSKSYLSLSVLRRRYRVSWRRPEILRRRSWLFNLVCRLWQWGIPLLLHTTKVQLESWIIIIKMIDMHALSQCPFPQFQWPGLRFVQMTPSFAGWSISRISGHRAACSTNPYTMVQLSSPCGSSGRPSQSSDSSGDIPPVKHCQYFPSTRSWDIAMLMNLLIDFISLHGSLGSLDERAVLCSLPFQMTAIVVAH